MNKVILIGNITKDIELKTTQSNKLFCTFTVAVSKRGKKDETNFINCQAWEKTAELLGQYCAKGSKVAVSGRIQVRNYDNSEGKKVYVTEVVVDEVMFLSQKKENSVDHDNDAGYETVDEGTLPF